MNYELHITRTAEKDLNNAADYIEFTLKNPLAADNLLDTAEEKINQLADFPQKHPVVDDAILSSWGIRFTAIKNYLAFYIIKENTVYLIRFLHGKRDWISILKQGFSLE